MERFSLPPPSVLPSSGLERWAPGLAVLRRYRREDLRHDLLAGVVLTAFLVPVGVGYAQAAGLPPITGLYATILPLIAYALVGPSRVMVLGPDSSLAAGIAAIVAPLARGQAETAVELAAMLAILTGIGIAAAGVLRLGFLTELLSRPVQLGYLAGVALLILVAQLPKAFGVKVAAAGIVGELVELGRAVAAGKWSGASLALGAGTVGVLAAGKRFAPRVPWALVCVVGGTVAVEVLELAGKVRVLGELPSGVPPFAPPVAALRFVPELVAGAIGIALITIADTSVLSQSIANQRAEEPQPDQELVAMGVANVAAGFFAGFPISASSSRTPVAIAAGARTQLTGLVGAVCVALVIVLAPGAMRSLPQPVLSGIVVVAAMGLVDGAGLARLYRARRSEASLAAITFAGVTSLGVLQGILVAVVLSLADFVRRAWRPHDAMLGRVDGMKGYHDTERYPEARRIPGLVLYRFDAPLFFANASYFRDRVRMLSRLRGAQWIVVAAEPVTDVDTTAADVLDALRRDLDERSVSLVFAEMKDPTKDRLRKAGVYEGFGDARFFPTLGTAVDAYLKAHPVEWTDWDE
jgi:high affinity sulfate transporter 1